MRNVEFVETSYASRTDFIVVQYSATNSGLPSSGRVRFFQGIVVRVVHEKVCDRRFLC
jgi:hypothetical protein